MIETKAGVIDRDYTGNVQVILINNSQHPYHVHTGDKIAQLITYRIAQPNPKPTSSLCATQRGHQEFGRFGSTDHPETQADTLKDANGAVQPTCDPIVGASSPAHLTPVHVIQQAELDPQINEQLRMPMKNLGVITRFNGIDIEQNRHYVKLHCKKYLMTMLQKHGWLTSHPASSAAPSGAPTSADSKLLTPNMTPTTAPGQKPPRPHGRTDTPFHTDRNTVRNLQEAPVPISDDQKRALHLKMGFSYRQLMGEIMYPMVKCRPDISPHTIFLSQFMDNPGEAHYQSLKEVALYLANMIDDGIHYWLSSPIMTLPDAPLPQTHPDNYTLINLGGTESMALIGYVDSDWAVNIKKRTSLTGAVVMLAGGVIGYKTKFQTVIAHSSTEAEFVAACKTAKMILFFRSLLEELGYAQEQATILYEDNTGALLMANAQQPTKRTRHMDIKHFALLDWVEQDLLQLQQISTHDNAADAMTKPLTRQLFYRNRDRYMGYRIPAYARSAQGLHSEVLSCSTAQSMGGV